MDKFKEQNKKLLYQGEKIFDTLALKFNEYILSLGDELYEKFSEIKNDKSYSLDSFIESCLDYVLEKINGEGIAIMFMESQLTENKVEYKDDSGDMIVVDYINNILGHKGDNMISQLVSKLEKINFNIY